MEQRNVNNREFYRRITWLYTKYQLLTKIVLFIFIFPIYKILLKSIIFSSGRFSISSGDYLGFLFSIQGIGLLLLSLIILTLLVGLDINAFIIMSALIKENKIELTARQLFIVGIKSLKSFMKPSGFFIIIYIGLIIPIVGVGLGVSVMNNFKIPNFITDVIFKNKLYLSLYLFALVTLVLITINYIFFFHYLIIEELPIRKALEKSSKLIRVNWKKFIKEFFIKTLILYALVSIIFIVICLILFGYASNIQDTFYQRFFTILISIIIAEGTSYFALMIVPFTTYKLTNLFYQFNTNYKSKINHNIYIKSKEYKDNKINLTTKLTIILFFTIVTLFNLGVSSSMAIFFDDIFKYNKNIEIIAHRAGGDLAAENSIIGMEKAIKLGASWSEIDVQRTKDGYYIINHDPTFTRVAGVNKKSSDLTLKEIEKLKIKDLFNKSGKDQPISTLEEFLNASKGKIGLFIELKGSTADAKMADDVIAMVKEKNMEKEVAILSLDYSLISYIEDKYPEMETGYLYFFSIGEINKLNADILIMEEQEATDKKISLIHKSGKKAIVWTVNTEDSINKFVLKDIDGIITDHVNMVQDGIKKRDNRSDIKIIIDTLWK